MGYSYRSGGGGGLPAWVIFLIAIAVVFGGYYLWVGFRGFLESGGLGIREATQRAEIIITATQERIATREAVIATRQATTFPTQTSLPPCQTFSVSVNVAIIRDRPSTNAGIVEQVPFGTEICVLSRAQTDEDWYLIDGNPRTRRLEEAYLREDLIQAVNPTPTPSRTFTPLPTVTDLPPTRTSTPTATP